MFAKGYIHVCEDVLWANDWGICVNDGPFAWTINCDTSVTNACVTRTIVVGRCIAEEGRPRYNFLHGEVVNK